MMFNFSINGVWKKIDLSTILGEISAVYQLFHCTRYKFKAGIVNIFPLFQKDSCAYSDEAL